MLELLNKDILQKYDFHDVEKKFIDMGIKNSNTNFWKFVKNNINYLSECVDWDKTVTSSIPFKNNLDQNFLDIATKLLPSEPYDENSWNIWTASISNNTGKKGKDLYMPLRIALTGKEKGPELKYLLPLLTEDYILKKFGIIS